MKKIIIIVITICCFCSCKSTLNLSQSEYNYKPLKFQYKLKRRTLKLKFVDDSTCVLINTFYCTDIAPEYKIIVQEFSYNRVGDSIYVRNKNPRFGNDLYIEIPVQNSKCCDFLNENKRERIDRTKIIYIGPNYSSDYEKYGRIPNITTGILNIVKNYIVYIRRDDQERIIGLYFFKKSN